MDIEIKTSCDLIEAESLLSKTLKFDANEIVNIKLARQIKSEFFLESRISALISSICMRFKNVNVIDWHKEWNEKDIEQYYKTSLIGLTAIVFSSCLKNIKEEIIPEEKRNVINKLSTLGGILEPKVPNEGSTARGTSLTFCAFDPAYGEPLALLGTVNNAQEFKNTFRLYRKFYFESGQGLPHTMATREATNALEDFIFELYQNGYLHGRLNETNNVIEGIRHVGIRKHYNRREMFLQKVKHFLELEKYITHVTHGLDYVNFYEVSISDNGMGLLDRLSHTRPDIPLPVNTRAQRIAAANRILTSAISSNINYPGSGCGLQRSLDAIYALNGFVSLRTHDVWLCGSANSSSRELMPVITQSELGKIVGTHYNILIPLRND